MALDLTQFRVIPPPDATVGLDLSKFNIVPPEEDSAPSFTDNLKTAISNTGKLAIEPIRAIGQSVGAVGGLTAALAKDVMSGNVLPSTRRPGLMPDLQNVGAFLAQRPQPADDELSPVQKGIA